MGLTHPKIDAILQHHKEKSMLSTLLKKLGRRKTGSWGRPGGKKQKRAANKAVRRALILKLEADYRAGMV